MCESIRIVLALCRVGLYALYRRLCCKGPTPVRPNFSVLCIGLENSGKSSILACLSGDDLHKIEPTIGFSIKAIMFEDCILEAKELGGGDKVRPYWDRYYQVFQGIIFVVAGNDADKNLTTAKDELTKAIEHHQLRSLPLLVLMTHQDVEGAHGTEQMTELLQGMPTMENRQWLVKGCTIHDKESLQQIFAQFNEILMKNLEHDIEQRKNSPQHSGNRL